MKNGILFVEKKGFIASVVSFFTRSKINHCAVQCNGFVYEIVSEPRWDKNLNRGINLLKYTSKHYNEVNTCTLVEADLVYSVVDTWYINNIDIGYDWWRSIFWTLRKFGRFGSKNKINCVEHAVITLALNDIKINSGNISPAQLKKELHDLFN